MQQVTPGIGDAFSPVEKALKENFAPELFEGLGDSVPKIGVIRLPVKHEGLNFPNPTQIAPKNCTAS